MIANRQDIPHYQQSHSEEEHSVHGRGGGQGDREEETIMGTDTDSVQCALWACTYCVPTVYLLCTTVPPTLEYVYALLLLPVRTTKSYWWSLTLCNNALHCSYSARHASKVERKVLTSIFDTVVGQVNNVTGSSHCLKCCTLSSIKTNLTLLATYD
jgi:hypothetical protein